MKKTILKLVSGGLLIVMLTLSVAALKPFTRRGTPPAAPPPAASIDSVINGITVASAGYVIGSLADEIMAVDANDTDEGNLEQGVQQEKKRSGLKGLFGRRKKQANEQRLTASTRPDSLGQAQENHDDRGERHE